MHSPHGASSPARARLTVAQYQSAPAEVLRAEVQRVTDALNACQEAYSRALADVNKSAAKSSRLQQQVKSLQEEDAVLSARVPLPINRLCRVRQWLSDKVTELDAEQAALEGKQMALLKAESKLRSQETEASLLDEAMHNLSTTAAADAADEARQAAAKQGREAAAARRQLRLAAAHRQQEQQMDAAEQQAAEERGRTAAACHSQARERLLASMATIQAGAAAVADVAAGQHAQKWEALQQLKTKVDEVRESVSKNAEMTRQLRKQKREQEQREFEALQEQGLNPYEVYRVRDAAAAAARAAKQLAAAKEQRRAGIATALAAEDVTYRQRVAKQEFDQQVEDNYQRQMGVTAQQQRTDAYMRGHTLTHQAILNPTSRMPVYPSEAVLVKPVAFGLGRSSPEALGKVAARHKHPVDLQDCALLPRKYRQHGMQAAGAATAATSDPDAAHAAAAGDAGLQSGSDAQSGASDSESHSAEARDVDSPSSSGAAAAGPDGAAGARGHRHARRDHKQLHVATLSKFEADRLQQAKQRHKELITQPKAAFGRVFAGDAFIADPPAITFKDFVPGQTYTATVQLINRSFTGGSIRLVGVPAEVMHVLELEMPPSACLAPGSAATLKVTFKPQADEPLSASVPLLANSGPLSLPFKALVRQALPSIEPSPLVSLDGRTGGVMLGASRHTSVPVSNAGVLPLMYSIKVLGPLAATTECEEPPGPPPPADASEADLEALQAKTWALASLSVAGLKVCGIKGRVHGYSSSSFSVEFSPHVPGVVEVPVLVSFTAPDFKGLSIPPISLTLTATGKELPVSTLTPVVDFKCVMFGQQYAAPLLLANAGKSAMKVVVAARPELGEWMTFNPDFGFIQASDTLAVTVELKPRPDMLHKLVKYLVPQHEDCFEVPVTVNVPGQPLPLPIKLRLQATTSDLILSPKTLDFGRVPLTEAAGVRLTITNPSALPQSFSFGSKLPLGLKLSPNAGYGRVLPRETVQLLATFQPPIPGAQFFDLTCRTLAGRLFKLEGKCEGLQPDVTLSHNVLKFPATAAGDSSSASLVVRNTSDAGRMFEFGVPSASYLKVTPRVGMLNPGSSMRVQIDFSPPAQQQDSCDTALAPAAAASPSSVGGNGAAVSSTTAQPQQQPSQQPQQQPSQQQAELQQQEQHGAASAAANYQDWLLPCCIKHVPDTSLGSNRGLASISTAYSTVQELPWETASSSGLNSNSSSSSMVPDLVLHLSVTTCAVSPELLLVSPELPTPPGKNYVVLDFGALPVGERITRQLVLQNKGPDVASLLAAPLDPAAAFSIVNALRPLEPCVGQGLVLLAFSPQDCCEYQEILTLRSCKSRLRVCLKGRGIAPTLAVSPASATAASGGLSFGDVLLSDPVCKELKVQVTNTCPFTISYSTRFIGSTSSGSSSSSRPPGAAAGQHAETQGKAPTAAGPAATPAAAAAVKPLAAQAGAAGANTAAGQQQQAASNPGPAAADPAAAGAAAAPVPSTAESPGTPSGCFTCSPSGGTLLAGQTQELTVVFAPLGTPGVTQNTTQLQGSRGPCGPLSPYVADRLQILVPHQQQDVVVPLQGNAWPDGVFVAGAAYCNSSSGLGSSSSSGGGCRAAANAQGSTAGGHAAAVAGGDCRMHEACGPLQDPFAAVLVAAAAAAAALPAAGPGGSNSSQAEGGKGKQAAAAAAGATGSTAQQQHDNKLLQLQGSALSRRDMPAALAAAGYCDLTQGLLKLPGPVHPGETRTATVEFGSIKSSFGGAAGELVVEELPVEVKEAGWSVDPVKVSVPAGERRPVTIRFTAPAAAKLAGTPLGAVSQQLQLPVLQQLKLILVLKGGCQAPAGAPAALPVAADGSRRVTLLCWCVLAPALPDDAPPAVGAAGAALTK